MAGEALDGYDFAVIGAGIAGASVACALSGAARVLLLEREAQPGYHTTGRSAALFSATYGPPVIRALSRASAGFFDHPPAGFTSHPLLTPRGVLFVARGDQLEQLEQLRSELANRGGVRVLDAAAMAMLAPLLRPAYPAAGLLEEGARDIDVHALHQGYLKGFRGNGGEIRANAEVLSLRREHEGWRIETRDAVHHANVIVNAAGAWADEVGVLAEAAPVGLIPKRRTALIVSAPADSATGDWPMVVDIEEQFYLKPDAGRLLISPADETPSPPCDAQPDELDIAICIDRIETAFDLRISRIENKWAGLRSFVADKSPVVGYDRSAPDFFWLAGQGGYGIQTAPALARCAAALLLGRDLPADIVDEGVTEAALSPNRLEVAA